MSTALVLSVPLYRIEVPGVPVPQGSMKVVPMGPRSGLVPGNERFLKPWRQAVTEAAQRAMDEQPRTLGAALSCPVRVRLVFRFPRPQAHYGSGRNAGSLRNGAPLHMTTTPDLDKLCRAVLDALTSAGMWRSDAQVYGIAAGKRYCEGGEHPGARIDVETA